MDTIATYIGAGRTLQGELTITFAVNDDYRLIEALNDLTGKEVWINAEKASKRHSAKARRYMWKLCDLIAKKLGSDKDTIYILMLQRAGVFEYMEIPEVTISQIEGFYRSVEKIDEYEAVRQSVDGTWQTVTMACIRCYEGMHDYTSKQLSDLINEIIQEANNLSIPTITEEELKRLAGVKE